MNLVGTRCRASAEVLQWPRRSAALPGSWLAFMALAAAKVTKAAVIRFEGPTAGRGTPNQGQLTKFWFKFTANNVIDNVE
jgi:hypothetical protein